MHNYEIYRFVKLADVFSLMNACFGFSAILFAAKGAFDTSFFFIVIAMIFDSLDGKVARRMGGGTNFGVDLDSIADTVSFGVAPAALLYYSSSLEPKIILFTALLFMCSAILRLTRWDIMRLFPKEHPQGKGIYTGLAAPVAAFIATSSIYIGNFFPECAATSDIAILIVYLGMSYFMLSAIEFKKPKWLF